MPDRSVRLHLACLTSGQHAESQLELTRIDDRRKHESRCLVGGTTEHQSLITCAQNAICTIDALIDILRLDGFWALIDAPQLTSRAACSVASIGLASATFHVIGVSP